MTVDFLWWWQDFNLRPWDYDTPAHCQSRLFSSIIEKGIKKKDTIPKEVKKHFFKDKEPPSLLSDYHAIGFDLEHSLVKFNLKEMTKLIVEGHLEDLKSKFAYPREVEFFDYDD